MTVIGVGDLQMASGEKLSGIVIEASREELLAMLDEIDPEDRTKGDGNGR